MENVARQTSDPYAAALEGRANPAEATAPATPEPANSGGLAPVTAHYDAVAANYHQQYDRDSLRDTSKPYPANYFRMQMMLNAFARAGAKRVIEVGVGEGTPLRTLAKAGIDVTGFDISEKMVATSKRKAKEAGMPTDQIFYGDIEDPATYIGCLQDGAFDGLMAMGVLPHVRNDRYVLENMRTLVRPGGTVFIEFRNKLFSLFTFNKYTYEFIMDDLLDGVSSAMKAKVAAELRDRVAMDEPRRRTLPSGASYDEIPAKFHNPFEVLDQFADMGFSDIQPLWYHYHAALPLLSRQDEQMFRDESMALEHETSGWRGMFLCSAFVVQATV